MHNNVVMLHDYLSTKDPDLKPTDDRTVITPNQFCEAICGKNNLQILQWLVTDPMNTCYFEADSDEMEFFGIKHQTLLVVDRLKTPAGL